MEPEDDANEDWEKKVKYLHDDAREEKEAKTVETRLQDLDQRVKSLEKYETCFCISTIIAIVAFLIALF